MQLREEFPAYSARLPPLPLKALEASVNRPTCSTQLFSNFAVAPSPTREINRPSSSGDQDRLKLRLFVDVASSELMGAGARADAVYRELDWVVQPASGAAID